MKSNLEAVVGNRFGRIGMKHGVVVAILSLGLVLALMFMMISAGSAQGEGAHIRMVRVLETDRVGLQNPAGLAYSRSTGAFHVVETGGMVSGLSSVSEVSLLSGGEDLIGTGRVPLAIDDAINMAFDDAHNRLLILQASSNELVQVEVDREGRLNRSVLARVDAGRFGVRDPQGMTVDPATGELMILDSATASIVRVRPAPGGRFEGAGVSQVELEAAGDLRGLAFDPSTGHLHVLERAEGVLYEVSDTGQVVATRDLSAFDLNDVQGMVFAPSGDLTDDPAEMSLYVADGSQVVEFSLAEPLAVIGANPATLVQTIDTSVFDPPSPDPAGIAYIGGNTYLFSDSEVNETPLFTGDNLFEMTAGGALVTTTTTTSFSNEPTGVAYNPVNDHIFISDDDQDMVFEIDPGSDGLHGTGDDSVTSFRTDDFGSTDPEGLTFDTVDGVLFIADDINSEIYRVAPGPNGLFDGVAPAGDDQVTSFDTASLGINSTSGITFNTDSGNLLIVGRPADLIAEVSTSGALVRAFDTSAADPRQPDGLAYGPGSGGSGAMSVYITDRGVDNNADPDENDGKIYEMSLPPITEGNEPPSVDAGPDQTVDITEITSLNGTVSDDGIPDPPGDVMVLWSQISGPGTANITDPNATSTTVIFSASGTYVLRLTAYDGELYASDDLSVEVTQDEVNNPPVAVDDAYTTDEDTVLNVAAPGVLANDSDPDGDPLTVVLVDDVSSGTLILNADGSFIYTPAPDFDGIATFSYQANDGTADSNVATVTITVEPVDIFSIYLPLVTKNH